MIKSLNDKHMVDYFKVNFNEKEPVGRENYSDFI